MMDMPVSVIVVGAGICGLSTAIACQKAGASVTVLEQAPDLLPLGTAISLWPNALNCLASWGMNADIAAIGQPFDHIATRHPDGKPIMQIDLTALHLKHGQKSRCVTRAALQSRLAAQISADNIQLDTNVESVETTAAEATVTLANGTALTADLVVVADGATSRLRTQILGESQQRPATYGAVLGLADYWRKPLGWGNVAEACEYYGPNGRFGVFRSDENQTYWFFVSSAIQGVTHATAADPNWMMEQLRDWPSFTRDLIAATPPNRMPHIAFHDRRSAPHWGNGRVVLAGDAAHPMLPNFGQGANQAIEDAHAIGLALERGNVGKDLATFYTQIRKQKADGLVKQSRQNGQLTQQEGRIGQAVRNMAMRVMPQWLVTRQLDDHFSLRHAD